MVHRLGATAGGDPLSVGVHRKPARADLLSPLWFRRCRPQPLSRRRPYRRGPHLEARPVTRPSALPPFTTAASLAGVAHGFFGRRGGVSAGGLASLNRGLGPDDAPALYGRSAKLTGGSKREGSDEEMVGRYL